MENIINSIRNLFTTYGFRCASIVVATILIVNLIKKPIVKKAQELMEKTGVDKSVVTKNITFLPVVVAFLLETVVTLVCAKFDFLALDFGRITSCSVMYGALAIATYESVKKHLEAYASSKNVSAVLPSNDTEEKIGLPIANDEENVVPSGSEQTGENLQTEEDVQVRFDVNN